MFSCSGFAAGFRSLRGNDASWERGNYSKMILLLVHKFLEDNFVNLGEGEA